MKPGLRQAALQKIWTPRSVAARVGRAIHNSFANLSEDLPLELRAALYQQYLTGNASARENAFVSLGMFQWDEDFVGLIETGLGDSSVGIRVIVSRYLVGTSREPICETQWAASVLDCLWNCRLDPEGEVRGNLWWALALNSLDPPDRLRNFLVAQLAEPGDVDRALWALQHMGLSAIPALPSVVDTVSTHIDSERSVIAGLRLIGQVGLASKEAIAVISKVVSAYPDNDRVIFWAMGACGAADERSNKAAAILALQVLSGSSERSKQAAIVSLGAIGIRSSQVIDAVRHSAAQMKPDAQIMEALKNLGLPMEEVLAPVLAELANGDYQKRIFAIESLQDIDSSIGKYAKPYLEEMLSDSRAQVREVAGETLEDLFDES